jgi:hypothetical protein
MRPVKDTDMNQVHTTDTGDYTYIIAETRVEDRDGKWVGSISRLKGSGTYQWMVGNLAIIPAGKIELTGRGSLLRGGKGRPRGRAQGEAEGGVIAPAKGAQQHEYKKDIFA